MFLLDTPLSISSLFKYGNIKFKDATNNTNKNVRIKLILKGFKYFLKYLKEFDLMICGSTVLKFSFGIYAKAL